MALTTLAREKINVKKKNKDNSFFLLDKSLKFKNKYKVNIVKQQNTVFINILFGSNNHQPPPSPPLSCPMFFQEIF